MSPSLGAMMPPVYSETWSRYRRITFTWTNNPNFTVGRYSTLRSHVQLEVQRLLGLLKPYRLVEKVLRLDPPTRDHVNMLLGQVTGEFHPHTWALRDPRYAGTARLYIPPIALKFARAWLRKAREVYRLIFFSPSLISSMTTPLLKEGPKGKIREGRKSAAEEIARLRAWSQARGIPWYGDTEGREGQ